MYDARTIQIPIFRDLKITVSLKAKIVSENLSFSPSTHRELKRIATGFGGLSELIDFSFFFSSFMRQQLRNTTAVSLSSSASSETSLDISREQTREGFPSLVSITSEPRLASSVFSDAPARFRAAHLEVDRLTQLLASLPPPSSTSAPSTPSSTSRRRVPLAPAPTFRVGDGVRIVNPRPHQENTGVVEFFRDSYT